MRSAARGRVDEEEDHAMTKPSGAASANPNPDFPEASSLLPCSGYYV